jgi:hypothetical protein
VSFKLLDSNFIQQKLTRGSRGAATKEFARAGLAEMKIELREVIKETPIDEGDLRESEHVTEPEVRGTQISISIVAGGPLAPHAYIVHEDPEAFHDEGDWKYIERPLLQAASYLGSRIAKRIDLNKVLG